MLKVKKFLMFFIIFILSITLTACNETTDPIPYKPIELPTTEKVQTKDETIYTVLNEESKLVSMKAVNHIRDACRNYYLDYGNFINNGNNNLSFAAPILVSEGLAKIPVLEAIDNFYYELNLNKDYYYSRLPYDINISYKLNDKEITAKELANKSGVVIIILDVVSNEKTEQYFKSKYMAQIQVPININSNKIIEAAGTNATVLVGSIMNLAYTVMPGSSAHYEIKIESTGFKFDGIQATYQPVSYESLINNINLDTSEQLSQIKLINPAINDIKNYGFNPIIRGTEPLFTNLEYLAKQLEGFVSDDNNLSISEIKDLENLKDLFIVPTTLVNTEITNYEEVTTKTMNLYQSLEESLDEFIIYSNILGEYLDQLSLRLPNITLNAEELNRNFHFLIEANSKLDILKTLFVDLEPLFESPDFISLIKNIDEYINVIEQIKIVKMGLENDLANLVTTMALSPMQITSIIEIVIEFFKHVNNFVFSIEPVKMALSEYGVYLKTNQLTFFKTDIDSQTAIGICLAVIYGDGNENIGLITKLEFIQEQFLSYTLEDFDVQIHLLEQMLIVDSETNLRPVDQIPLSFIALNNSLNVSSSETYVSFFSSIDLIVSNFINLTTIKSLFPIADVPPVSFLSSQNEIPNSVHFVVKQLPLS